MKKSTWIRTIGSCFFALQMFSASAQQLPVMNHYIYNPYLYNPARTGQNDMGSINLNFKRQWTAAPYTPITGIVSIESPIKGSKLGDMGLGGMLYTDKTHLITKIGGMATYAYHVPFSKSPDFKHRLGIGLSLGFMNQRLDFASATVGDEADQQVLAEVSNGTSFDFSGGINYNYKDLNIGIAFLQGLGNSVRFINPANIENTFELKPHFIWTASYRFRLSPPDKQHRFFIEPVVMGRIVSNLPYQAEINALFGVEKIAWLGVGYRSSNIQTSTSAINVSMGTEIMQRVMMAYTVEMAAEGRLNNSLGLQHEITLSYRFGQNQEQMNKMAMMEEEIQLLKDKDAELEERIVEQETIIQTRIDSIKVEMETANEEERVAMEETIAEYQEQLDAQNETINDMQKDIDELRDLIKDRPLEYKKLGEVYFATGKAGLDPMAQANLDAVVGLLKEKPNAKIYLYGHASTDGSAKVNQELSEKRAVSVRNYLINKHGINGERITMLPFGSDSPAKGDLNTVDSQDRRVEIIVSE